MTDKIFITGPHNSDKMNLARKLIEYNDSLSIGERFTNDMDYKDKENEDYIYFLSTQSIDLTYKNNFMLFVNTNNFISTGITMDNYYNSDVFVMEMDEFNNISNNVFKLESTDIIVVWLDANYSKNNDFSGNDIVEASFLEERLINDNIKYLYFYGEDIDTISAIILRYLNSDPEERDKILNENKELIDFEMNE